MDGRSGGGGQGPGALRARDVAPELRAVLPHQEPAPLGEGDQAARLAQLVGGAAPGGQRHPARRAHLHLDPDRGPGQPRPLRQVRGGVPQEGRRGGPLPREAGAAVHPGGGAEPLAGDPRGPAHRAHGPHAPLPHPLQQLQRGGEDALPRDPPQPDPLPAHRQEVQARPRPHPEPGHRHPHPRHPRAQRAQAQVGDAHRSTRPRAHPQDARLRALWRRASKSGDCAGVMYLAHIYFAR